MKARGGIILATTILLLAAPYLYVRRALKPPDNPLDDDPDWDVPEPKLIDLMRNPASDVPGAYWGGSVDVLAAPVFVEGDGWITKYPPIPQPDWVRAANRNTDAFCASLIAAGQSDNAPVHAAPNTSEEQRNND